MTISTDDMMAVVTKHFGEGAAKLRTLLEWDRYDEKRYPVHVTLKGNSDGSYQVVLGFQSVGGVLYFTLAPYPACCGIRMFHSFRVVETIPQDFVDDFMNAFVATFDAWNLLGAAKRFEVIMVEVGRHGNLSAVQRRAYLDASRECPVTENPTIQYPQFYNYFHKHAKLVRTRLQMNTNSGNILHNMEVIFA